MGSSIVIPTPFEQREMARNPFTSLVTSLLGKTEELAWMITRKGAR